MISLMTTVKMTDRSVTLACSRRVSVPATGLSAAALLPISPVRERSERPTQAPAVAAAKAQAQAYAFAAAANGAGAGTATGAAGANGHAIGQQKTQQHGKWAFRGLEPWSDPA
ncbi:hypothetical protein [Actinacidiphila acidipaludis]|uniref:Uncharacterized protein n=1 Tax=Actinacidiphila acidipaludis TaxID=2873382 RepID=A0ABS7Q1F1_9ACTN|nr:hypothetical protein [Streptomyces acidipaludis]MBY8876957.1 hypothetical protein [Streptomyces acidipaludis]